MTANQDAAKNEQKPYQNKKILALITFVAIISLFYSLFITVQMHKQLQTLTLITTNMKQQQANNQAEIDNRIKALTGSQMRLVDNLNEVKKTVKTALEERLYQNNDWLLLKIRYYLELAAINQNWGDNTQTSIALLHEALSLLTNLHDSRLFSIMQAINHDKAELEATPVVDKAALLFQLDAALLLTKTLEIKSPRIPANIGSSDRVARPLALTWRDYLEKSIHELKQLVIIRHQSQAIQPLATSDDEAMFRNTIFLALQQAQWSVLQQNQAVYDLSLTQAIDTIHRDFDPDSHQTKTLIDQLHQVQSIKFQQKQIVSKQSLLLLNQLITEKQTPMSGEHAQ
jgi:uroporphyrin-III C-methyltransferase